MSTPHFRIPFTLHLRLSAFICGSILALMLISQASAQRRVSAPDDLGAALAQAKSGETLVLEDGVYRDQALSLRGRGEEGKPITIRAATPGKVTFTGKSSVEIRGAWLVLDGFRFENCVVGPITLRDADHCRVTNCAVIRCNPDDNSRIHWIRIAGAESHHNRIDHCYTEGKLKDGVVLVIDGDEQKGKMSADNRVDHNHFKDVVRAVNNGMETIRIGTSSVAQFDARALVEHNLFQNASGDAEIISSKSCSNIYRYNTFVDCDGGVVMRHGHRSTVEGNFFFGSGRPRTAGIRVHGSDHRVVNNYLSGLGQFSISLPAGQSKFVPTGHEPTLRCVVAHNTVVDPVGPAILLGSDRGNVRDTAPAGTTLVNNLVTGSRAALVRELFPGPAEWRGNLLFASGEAQAGVAAGAQGVLLADPKLEKAADGLWRPAADSPAIGAGVKPPIRVMEDMDGQPRGSRPDIGADQRSTDPILRRPLKPADVGPEWMLKT
jgi:chondroitinase B-like protein